MILGIHWLSTLGPIIWDFYKLEMQFSYRRRIIVIQGNQQASVQWMEGKTMLRELSTSTAPHIFAIQVHSIIEECMSELLDAS